MNLWPGSFDTTKERSPLFHLYEQSSKLEDKHGICLHGERISHDKMKFTIGDVGHFVNGIELFEISNPDGYPCKIHFDSAIKRARTEAEFIGELAKVLNHQKTKLAISDLLR